MSRKSPFPNSRAALLGEVLKAKNTLPKGYKTKAEDERDPVREAFYKDLTSEEGHRLRAFLQKLYDRQERERGQSAGSGAGQGKPVEAESDRPTWRPVTSFQVRAYEFLLNARLDEPEAQGPRVEPDETSPVELTEREAAELEAIQAMIRKRRESDAAGF